MEVWTIAYEVEQRTTEGLLWDLVVGHMSIQVSGSRFTAPFPVKLVQKDIGYVSSAATLTR